MNDLVRRVSHSLTTRNGKTLRESAERRSRSGSRSRSRIVVVAVLSVVAVQKNN